MKKLLIFILSVVMLFSSLSLYACNDDKPQSQTPENGIVNPDNRTPQEPPAPRIKAPVYGSVIEGVYAAEDQEDLEKFIGGVYNDDLTVNDGVSDRGLIICPYFDLTVNDVEITVYSARTLSGLHSFCYVNAEDDSFPLSVKLLNKDGSVALKKEIETYGNFVYYTENGEAFSVFVRDKSVYVEPEGYTTVEIAPGTHGEDDITLEGLCSDLYQTYISGYGGKRVNISYDDCNPFGMIAGHFGEIADLLGHAEQSASDSTVAAFDSLAESFASFMANFEIPSDGTEYIPSVDGDALNAYSAFFSKATDLYNSSLVSFAKNVSSDVNKSAVIGANYPYSIALGADTGVEPIEFRSAIANLLGFNSEAEFTACAKDLAAAYTQYRSDLANSAEVNEAMENGCFYTANGCFIFPIAVKNDLPSTLLAYVILDTNGLLSVWVNDITAALFATNFNASYCTEDTIDNTLYCKNVLFVTGPVEKENVVLRFLPGVHYLSYSIKLLSKTSVYLDDGAYLFVSSPDAPESGAVSSGEDPTIASKWNMLFFADGKNTVKLYGKGVIDFSGIAYSSEDKTGKICFYADGSNTIEISGITIINSPERSLWVKRSFNVTVNDVKIISYRTGAEGLMLTDCGRRIIDKTDCVVKNCFIRAGADCFTLHSNHYNTAVYMNNLYFTGCFAIADGGNAFTFNAGRTGRQIKQIYITDCAAIALSSAEGEGAALQFSSTAENAKITDVTVENFTVYYAKNYALDIYCGDFECEISDITATIEVLGENSSALKISASENGVIKNISVNSEKISVNDVTLEDEFSNVSGFTLNSQKVAATNS